MGVEREVNPRGSGERLREELIVAALRLLERDGRDARLGLRAVAREAGVAAPSVYAHFASVDELAAAVLDRLTGEFVDGVFGAIPDSLAPRERVVAAIRNYVSWGLAHPGHYTAAMEGHVLRLVDDEREIGRRHVEAVLALVLPDLVVLAGDADQALRRAHGLWAAAHGVVSLRLAKPYYDWPPEADQVAWIVDAVGVGDEGR